MTIHIIHAEYPPSCYSDEYHILEHSPIGTELFPAYSVIGTNSSAVSYSLLYETSISIHPDSGLLVITKDIDYETTPSHKLILMISIMIHRLFLTVHVENIHNASLFCEATLIITIHDIPENPVFNTSQNWSNSFFSDIVIVNETISVGTTIGNTLSFYDPDLNDSHTFSLECIHNLICPFAITSLGQVYLNTTDGFDYELQSSFILHIFVTDSTGLTDDTYKWIELQNVNESPSFDSSVLYRVGYYPFKLNSPVGVPVGIPVTANDPEGNIIDYSISDDHFAIDQNGQIYVIQDINPTLEYCTTVTAIDSEELSANVTVIISFTIKSSSFSLSSSFITIPENMPINSLIQPSLQIIGLYEQPLHYELICNDYCPFSMNNSSSTLTLISSLDYERKNLYNITIVVTDKYNQQASCNTTILITDINEPPQLDISSCSIQRTVYQNATTNTIIYPAINATDPDLFDSLYFSIQPNTPFAIHPYTGLLYIQNTTLLHQLNSLVYSLLIQVTDIQGLSDSCWIHLHIIPEEQKPILRWIESSIYLYENIPINSTHDISYYVEYDKQDLFYSIEDITSIHNISYSFPFILQECSLILITPLDYEIQTFYEIRFCISNSLQYQDCQNLTIYVMNVNEPPSFTFIPSILSISETTQPSSILTTIIAIDPEDSPVYYSLISSGSSPFAINSTSGALSLLYPIDYEIQSVYNFTIVAMDSEGYSSSATISILIEDANDPPFCHSPISLTVLEDTPLHTPLHQIEVDDIEVQQGKQTLSYSILTINSPFSILSNGILVFSQSLSSFEQSVYSLTIQITDSGQPPLSCLCSISVTIIPVKHYPQLTYNSTILHIPENQPVFSSIPTTIQIINNQSNQQYFFSLNTTQFFDIHPISGELFLKKPLDYESQSIIPLLIHVADSKDSSYSSFLSFTIIIDNVNEPPILLTHSLQIMENSPFNTSLGIIQYDDVDSGINGTVHCIQSNLFNLFYINQNTCGVYLINEIDYESQNEYSLEIILQDGGGLETEGIITIHILDENEPPILYLSQHDFIIPSNLPESSIILSFSYKDPENDPVFASLQSTTILPFELYMLNQTIQLRSNSIIDHSSYSFSILVEDSFGHSISTPITISTISSVQHTPSIHSIDCSIPEHSLIHSILPNCILQIQHPEHYQSITYSLLFSMITPPFTIISYNTTAVSFRITDDLDYETINTYVLPIQVDVISHIDNQEYSIQTHVTIHIIDVNEPPIFINFPTILNIEENLSINTTLYPCLYAKDPENQPITYSIHDNEWFAIQPITGCLYIKKEGIDFENPNQPNQFTLLCTAQDLEGLSTSKSLVIHIMNVNEPPSFSSPSYSISLPLPISTNTSIPLPIQVSDPDNQNLSYSILQQSCENAFIVDSSSPSIYTSFTLPSFFTEVDKNITCIVYLQVQDTKGLTDSTLLYIHLVSSVYPPTIHSTQFSIQENPSFGEMIGRIEVTSNWNSIHPMISTYLQPSPYSSFIELNHTSHILSVKQPSFFDYETIESFSIFVIAVDESCYNATTIKEIYIHILNVNEPPIVYDQEYHIYSDITYPLLLSPPIQAIDPEGSVVVYSFDSQHSNLTIDNYGRVTILGSLSSSNHSTTIHSSQFITHSYHYLVAAVDNAIPPLSSYFTITIHVNQFLISNQTHSLSFIEGTNTTRSISEDASIGEYIGSPLEVYNDDSLVYYQIDTCIPSCPIMIHSTSGQLIVVSSLDFEETPLYWLNVTATNGYGIVSIEVLLYIQDVDDCVVTTISPSIIPISGGWIEFNGLNVGPIQLNSSLIISMEESSLLSFTPSIQINASYNLFDQNNHSIQQGLLSQCETLSTNHSIRCLIPPTIAHHILFSLQWQSSLPNAILHSCSISSILHYPSVHINHMTGVSAIPTEGGSVCFEADSIGTFELYQSIPSRNAINASVELIDGIQRSLSSCSFSSSNSICCIVDKGYGSSLTWTLCFYGQCDSIQQGSYSSPQITSVTSSSSSLNCVGGDIIIITGSNLGSDLSTLIVYMEDEQSQKILQNCHYSIFHTQIQCTMNEGYGSNLLFSIQVGDQLSPLFISSLSFSGPIITSVFGIGSMNAFTIGGQEVLIQGENLGISNTSILLYYGNSTKMSYTSTCHILQKHILLQCITVEGNGYQDQWQVQVGQQVSNLHSQNHSIYGIPLVTSIDKPNSFMPLEGGMVITIHGMNFGNDSSLLQVQYENENGIIYTPSCLIVQNHSIIQCTTVPGYGKHIEWSINVNNLINPHAFSLSYLTPQLLNITCKDTCGRTKGGDYLLLHGLFYTPLNSEVIASYGYTGIEFIAKNCRVLSNTLIECTSVPGVGQNLHWSLSLNGMEVYCPSNITYSYTSTQISYPASQPLPLKGGSELVLHTSNDFTFCSSCSFQVVVNSIAVEAGIMNETTIFCYSPSIHSPSIQAHVLISLHERIVEITNTVTIPLQNPIIQSISVESTIQQQSKVYLLSLIGLNFGFSSYDFYIYLERAPNQIVPCNIITVSNEFASCMTSYSQGNVTVSRSNSFSNTVHYEINDVEFIMDWDHSNNSYSVYPYLFHTIGGELLEIHGYSIPSSISLFINNSQTIIQFINSTFIQCSIPPGEGRMIPVEIRQQQQILLQFFISYKAPIITSILPSSLLYSTDILVIEGEEFGLNPILHVTGIESESLNCSLLSTSHTSISCSLSSIDPLGLILQIEVAHQFSNIITIPTVSPHLSSLTILSSITESSGNEIVEGEVLTGLPTAGNVIIHLQGVNLNAPSLQCIMNNNEIITLYHNATDVYCLVPEVFTATALFSLQYSIHSTNQIEASILPPTITSILPPIGNTTGNDLITIEGMNFGCSLSYLSSIQLTVNNQLLPILSCSHTSIQFVSPSGEGIHIPVYLSHYTHIASTFFSYKPPFIQSVSISSTSSNYQVILTGEQFGIHSGIVHVGENQCLVYYQSHSSLHCLLPHILGGTYPITLEVSNQTSNTVSYSFPLPMIHSVSPQLIQAKESIILLSGSNLPVLSNCSILLSISSFSISSCHLSLLPSPSIECHLPVLPRGTHLLSLQINNQTIPIHPKAQFLTVICLENQYAIEGDYCEDCPSSTICPINTTIPIAPPGEWIFNTASKKPESVPCFNPSACAGSNQCYEGYSSTKCSKCIKGYTRTNTWTCTKCSSGLQLYFPILSFIVVCIFLYLASIAQFSKSFIWLTLLIQSFQIIGLLSLLQPQLSSLQSIIHFSSLFLLNMEQFHFDCIFQSLSQLQIWMIGLLVFVVCFLLDCLLHLFKHSLGSFLTRLTSVFNILLLPLLYHSFLSLSCKNSFYMADYSIQFTSQTMCWNESSYLWILVIAFLLFIIPFILFCYSSTQAYQEKQLSIAMHANLQQVSKANQLVDLFYSRRLLLLGTVYNNSSLIPFYVGMIIKLFLVMIMIFCSDRKWLESLLLLLLLLPILYFILLNTPFNTEHDYYSTILSRSTLSSLSSQSSHSICISQKTNKKWFVNVNSLVACILLLFISCYFTCILSPSTSSLLVKIVCIFLQWTILLVYSLFIFSGCMECVSLFTHKPYSFVDKEILPSITSQEEIIFLRNMKNEMNEETRNKMEDCVRNSVIIPEIDYPMKSDLNEIANLSFASLVQESTKKMNVNRIDNENDRNNENQKRENGNVMRVFEKMMSGK